MEFSINAIIGILLALVVVFVLIILSAMGIFDPVKKFLNWQSFEERCEGLTKTNYDSYIKGYNKAEDFIEEKQLCNRYKKCFPIEFRKLKDTSKNKENYCGMVLRS